MVKKWKLVLAAGLLVLPLAFASNPSASQPLCDAKRSWLDAAFCMRCAYGPYCGDCRLTRCAGEVEEGLDGG